MKGLKRGEKGFTLIEIIIVLVIVSILAAVIVPRMGGFLGRGKSTAFTGEMQTLQLAVDAYYSDSAVVRGDLPGDPEGPGLYPTYNGKGMEWTSDTWPASATEARDKAKSSIINMDFIMSYGKYDTNGYIKEGYINDYAKSADGYNKKSGNMDALPGSYCWYINEKGEVSARYYDTSTKKWLEGYQDVYP